MSVRFRSSPARGGGSPKAVEGGLPRHAAAEENPLRQPLRGRHLPVPGRIRESNHADA
jgi:hypothetical protein